MSSIELAEKGIVPDALIRLGIRKLLRQRLSDESADDVEVQGVRYRTLLEQLRQSPVAIETKAANEQHYEVPARFFQLVLGENLKYSSCLWDEGTPDLGSAEANMLTRCMESAQIEDGHDILELGCGWGSLTLWMARQFPGSRITAVSNSNSQREFIEQQARLRGYDNLRIITCDVNDLSLDQRFDRVVSVEMFEHVRNYRTLMQRIDSWLRPGGKLFIHIFCHRFLAYPFEVDGEDNWMGRYFFTGGLMPARDTLLHFQQNLRLEQQWDYSGSHYQKTAEAWLQNLDTYRDQIQDLFAEVYGTEGAKVWVQRWRMFFMSCAELFGYRGGSEWMVSHYLFEKAGDEQERTTA